jgi:FtsP/CotA-like multicopper oxidase with cupredoxin domain
VSGSWAIDDQLYPQADWLDVRPNEHVRFVVRNDSEMVHPMHLHGHFVVVDGVVMDTVPVGPGETRVLDFYTDNPGRWLFHCHNDYHLASGMARVVRYVDDGS